MGRNNKQQIRAAVSASLLQHTSAIGLCSIAIMIGIYRRVVRAIAVDH